MSANLYYRQSELAAAKLLDTAVPEGVMETLDNAFGSRTPHLTRSSIGALQGIIAARKAAGIDCKPFEQMVKGLERYDEIDIISQY